MLTLRFRRKSQAEWLVAYVLVFSIIQSGIINFLNMPSAIKYTIDFAWCSILILLSTKRLPALTKDLHIFIIIIGAYFLCTLIVYILNFQSVFYYLWGLRNNFRFYVFFVACSLILKEEWLEGYLNFLDKLFWINFPMVMFQYMIQGHSGDHLGGIFGVEKGCNAYMNIFLLIVLSRAVLQYLHKQKTLSECIVKCLVGLVIAVLSELKVMIVELVLLVMLTSMMVRLTPRKILLVISMIVGIFLAVRAISVLFPSFDGWFSINGIIEILTSESGYTGRNDLNRLTAVPVVLERFLPRLTDKIFGLGLGNCDYATFDFLKTPFYHSHKSLHYYWFSSAYIVLETGLLGLCLYLSFFIVVFFAAHRREKNNCANVIYCQLSKIMAFMFIITVFYNSALRTEAGYMAFFALALPFVRRSGMKEQQSQDLSVEE